MPQALVLVDIQNDYFADGAVALAGMVQAAERARSVLDQARIRGLAVFHVRHLSVRLDATFFLPGTHGAEIHPSATPIGGEPVIDKQFPNSFRGTSLLDGPSPEE